MSTALIVFLNVFFIAFVLVAIVGLCARSIVSDRTVTADQAVAADRTVTASIARRRARRRTAFQGTALQGRSRTTAPAGRRAGRALDLRA